MAALVKGEGSDGSEVDVVGSESEIDDDAAEDENEGKASNVENSNDSSADEEVFF